MVHCAGISLRGLYEYIYSITLGIMIDIYDPIQNSFISSFFRDSFILKKFLLNTTTQLLRIFLNK